MRTRRSTFVIFLLIAGLAGWASRVEAQTSETKREKIKKLLEVTQVAGQSKEVLTAIVSMMKPEFPDTTQEVWEEVIADLDMQNLIDQMVPIYDEHLTEQELDDLIVFFSSPSGRSFIQKQPAIMAESFAAGQRWGQELAQELRRRLQERKNKVVGP